VSAAPVVHFRYHAGVRRHDRIVDAVALLLIVIGVALYADSQLRFRNIMRYSYLHPGPRGVSQLKAADHARYEANTAFGLVTLGAVVGVGAAIRHSRRSS
jgi:hypothetical protein